MFCCGVVFLIRTNLSIVGRICSLLLWGLILEVSSSDIGRQFTIYGCTGHGDSPILRLLVDNLNQSSHGVSFGLFIQQDSRSGRC